MPSPAFDTDFMDALGERVLIADGAMGTMLQAADLTLDDFANLEGCNEILNDTRPDVVRHIHRAYLEAGADAVETNTFGANLPNLADYDIPDRIRELSFKGTQLAREVADEMSTSDRRRYVLGSVGPGTKLPTLGHATFASLRDAYSECAAGMLDGGADAILIETCQDLLQVKAAVLGAKRAMVTEGRRIPIITQVSMETTGTMLLGSEIGAALTALEPLGIDLIGLNCSTGPAEMSEHGRVRVEGRLVRAHLTLVEQLLQARAQQAPLVEVLVAAVAAVDYDAAHPATLQQRLVHGEVGQVGQDLVAVAVGQLLCVVRLRGVQRQRGIVRIPGEGVRWQGVRRHLLDDTHPPRGAGGRRGTPPVAGDSR